MPGVLTKFYNSSIQWAINYVEGTSYCGIRKKIPDIKTITQYEIALEEAVTEFICAGDDKYIVELLSDAKKNNKWPRKYQSYDVGECVIGDQVAKSSRFYIKDGIRLVVKFQQVIVSVYPGYFEVNSQRDLPDSYLKKWLSKETLAKLIEFQNVLEEIVELEA